MSAETKRKAIEACMNMNPLDREQSVTSAVDALEALMREVADERIAAHRVVPAPEPEPAKCADCSPGCDGGAERRWHTSGSGPCSECGCHAYRAVQAKCATPPSANVPLYPQAPGVVAALEAETPSAKGPPETITIVPVPDRPGYEGEDTSGWMVETGPARSLGQTKREPLRVEYTRSDLVAAKVAEAVAEYSHKERPEADRILGCGQYETVLEAARRVVADRDMWQSQALDWQGKVEAAEKRVAELAEGSEHYHDRAEKAEAELADVRTVSNARLDMVHKREAELAECKAKLVAMQEWAGKLPAVMVRWP